MKTDNQYEKQANEFLSANGIEFRAVLIGDDCPLPWSASQAQTVSLLLLLLPVLGDAANTLEVRWVRCWPHGDAVGIYFDNEHSQNENRVPTSVEFITRTRTSRNGAD